MASTEKTGDIKLFVSLGTKKYEVAGREAMTWGDVVADVAGQAGLGPCALRILYKGRSAVTGKTLGDDKVKTGTKLIAMKSKAHHAAEETRERRERAAADAAAADRLWNASESDAPPPAVAAPGTACTSFGDDIDGIGPADFYVRVGHAGKVYNVRLSSDACVSHLKKRIAELVGVTERDQRLVFKGKSEFRDTAALVVNLGAKRGSHFMVLARREYHDAIEAKKDVAMLGNEVVSIGEKLSRVERKVRGRLLSEYGEVILAIGEVDAEVERLSGNLEAIRVAGNSEEKSQAQEISQKLEKMRKDLVALREHASRAFA